MPRPKRFGRLVRSSPIGNIYKNSGRITASERDIGDQNRFRLKKSPRQVENSIFRESKRAGLISLIKPARRLCNLVVRRARTLA